MTFRISGTDGAGQALPQAQLDRFLSLILSREPEFAVRVADGLEIAIHNNYDIHLLRAVVDDPARRGTEEFQVMLNLAALFAFGFPIVEPLRVSIKFAGTVPP